MATKGKNETAAPKTRGRAAQAGDPEPTNGLGVATGNVTNKTRSGQAERHAAARRRRGSKIWDGTASGGGSEELGGNLKDGSVRSIFYQRTLKWARNLAESAPAEVLQEALSSASARGTIVHVLGNVPVEQEKSEEEILLERAQERALIVQEQLRREAGGLVSTQEVVDRTGLSRQTVDRYRKEGKLLALETAQGFRFPLCQFHGQEIVPGLDEALAAMEGSSFWETLSGLITPTPTLNNRSVLDALRDGPSAEERAHIVSIAYDYANE